MRALSLVVVSLLSMSVHYTASVIAWSKDGSSALIERIASGPEGGGSLAYSVWCGGRSFEVQLSSDFSPGGSELPQTVSVKTCTERVTSLQTALTTRGFDTVKTDATRCKRRESMVVATESREPAPLTQLKSGKTLSISDGAQVLLETTLPGTALISPSGTMVLLINEESSSPVQGAWSRKPGQPFTKCE